MPQFTKFSQDTFIFRSSSVPQTLSGRAIDFLELRSEVKIKTWIFRKEVILTMHICITLTGIHCTNWPDVRHHYRQLRLEQLIEEVHGFPGLHDTVGVRQGNILSHEYRGYRILWLPRDNSQGVSDHNAIRAFLGKLAMMLRIIWYLI